VPLSEHEQRLLDQIERQLYAEDPKFASAVRSHDVKSHLLRRVKRFVALLLLGLAALLGGVMIRNVFVGVAGFLVMLAAGLVIARSVQRLSRGDNPMPLPKAAKGKKKGKKGGPPRGSLRERAEERFRRRFEDPES
jgi:predicted lipid-binding transport protein (Tim44 family)